MFFRVQGTRVSEPAAALKDVYVNVVAVMPHTLTDRFFDTFPQEIV